MKPILPLVLLFTSGFLNSGCNNSSNEAADTASVKEIALEQEYPPADTTYPAAPEQKVPSSPSASPGAESPAVKPDWDKKIIKTATLQAEVKDYNVFSKALAQKVKGLGGYISSEQQSRTEYRVENAITIKVPVALFDAAVETILKDVKEVETRQISSEDVSTAYIDSKSRLEAKKQVRLRYLELLKGAKNMSDIIEVQKEINAIQEEIEMVTGRINYLGHASAMSTIQLTYYQVLNASVADKGTPRFLEELKDSFANGWYWLGELLLGLVAIWPLVLLIGFIVFLIRKKQIVRTR